MSKITLHLDEATQVFVTEAAKAHGVSKSRWVADIIRKYATQEWPRDCLALAGRFPDFPLRDEELAAQQPLDMPRHRLLIGKICPNQNKLG
ncbi:MAG: CopG family transcriptional regulator [Giesbergeria sp.]|uniref:CopG family transcriptional regulator n=1 Tax=Giesbergeria sp. TaxID=2818473 RepID=UPI0026357878|nr:CopG family transcriptional regulator [Giesbergeria sp.]MDD2609349.1 CopG family transcriptional regulator [Giesbergeria sp.]